MGGFSHIVFHRPAGNPNSPRIQPWVAFHLDLQRKFKDLEKHVPTIHRPEVSFSLRRRTGESELSRSRGSLTGRARPCARSSPEPVRIRAYPTIHRGGTDFFHTYPRLCPEESSPPPPPRPEREACAARRGAAQPPSHAFRSRPGRTTRHLGPLVARNPDVATALVARALAQGSEAAGMPVSIDVPDGQGAFRQRLLAAGFAPLRPFTRMLRDHGATAGAADLTFAIAGPELG